MAPMTGAGLGGRRGQVAANAGAGACRLTRRTVAADVVPETVLEGTRGQGPMP